MLKRLLVTVIGIPLLFVLLIFGNKYIIDCVVALLALMSIYEYMKCYSQKFKPVSWMGYVASILIAFIHIIPREYVLSYLGMAIVSIIAILFVQVIVTEMKTNAVDIAISFFGIVYIVRIFCIYSFAFWNGK